MSMTLGKSGSAASEMNVTPLIDVLLVLLIIFMVLPHHQGEKVEIPQPSNSRISLPSPEKTVVVQINDVGDDKPPTVTINRKEVGWDKLSSALQEIYQNRREKALFLKGDPEVDFEYVVEAVDIAHKAGVDRVGLLGANQGADE